MAQLNPNSPFVSWILTEDELKHAAVLSTPQKQYIQNIIHERMIEKMNLSWTPENVQREAELKGEIGTLQFLISCSDEFEEKIRSEQPAQ